LFLYRALYLALDPLSKTLTTPHKVWPISRTLDLATRARYSLSPCILHRNAFKWRYIPPTLFCRFFPQELGLHLSRWRGAGTPENALEFHKVDRITIIHCSSLTWMLFSGQSRSPAILFTRFSFELTWTLTHAHFYH
jgi:hypothetical protein